MSYGDIARLALTLVESVCKRFRPKNSAHFFRVYLTPRQASTFAIPSPADEAFQYLVWKSGLSIPFQGPHCLRHSFAVHLLKNGTPLKTIGDILGHRAAESTSMYLRLATRDLREVALEVPEAARYRDLNPMTTHSYELLRNPCLDRPSSHLR